MTTSRRDAGGSAFGEWLRNNPRLDSVKQNLTIADIDWIVWKYKTVIDKQGERSLKLALWIELKTYGANLNQAQQELLFAYHTLLNDKRKRMFSPFVGKTVSFWSFGCSIVQLSSDTPITSKIIRYGRFDDKGQLNYVEIKCGQLEKIITFVIDPETLRPFSFRRHHKTSLLVMDEQAPLGFQYSRLIKKSS